jgi:tetratricopeptide (TPR) repeat protein
VGFRERRLFGFDGIYCKNLKENTANFLKITNKKMRVHDGPNTKEFMKSINSATENFEKDPFKAIRLLSHLIEISKEYSSGRFPRGLIYEYLGEYSAAIDDYKIAQLKAPEAKERLAFALYKSANVGEVEQARSILKGLAASGNRKAFHLLGQIEMNGRIGIRSFNQASTYFEKDASNNASKVLYIRSQQLAGHLSDKKSASKYRKHCERDIAFSCSYLAASYQSFDKKLSNKLFKAYESKLIRKCKNVRSNLPHETGCYNLLVHFSTNKKFEKAKTLFIEMRHYGLLPADNLKWDTDVDNIRDQDWFQAYLL